MWLISDKGLRELLGGDYTMVIRCKQQHKETPIKILSYFQFVYLSYDGFRKFYNKTLSKIINDVKYVHDDTIIGKILKMVVGR